MDSLATDIRKRLGPFPTLEEHPVVSAIVINRSGVEDLQGLLTGLREHTDYPQVEPIVVDDGSYGLSLSEARNLGAERARGDLLLFLDGSTELFEPGWLHELVASFLQSDAGAVTATLVQPNAGNRRASAHGYPIQQRGLAFREEEGRVIPEPCDWKHATLDQALSEDIECDAATTACLLLERRAFEEVGGFSPGYVASREDVDLCMKLRALGMRVVCSGRSIAIHHPLSPGDAMPAEKRRKLTATDHRRLWWRWGPRLQSFDMRPQAMPLLRHAHARLTITFGHLVALQMLRDPDVFFVQIGAFDGKTGDQIYPYVTRHDWRGIAVEPQPWYFAKLQETYRGREGIELRNVAIAERPGHRSLYAIDPQVPDLPAWTGGIASFDRGHLERAEVHGPDGENVIEELTVECIPVSDLLAGVERVDVLQIDVEGFDAEVIRLFPFSAYRPSVVRFESFCLSRSDHEAAVERLAGYGYKLAVTGVDTIAWHEG